MSGPIAQSANADGGMLWGGAAAVLAAGQHSAPVTHWVPRILLTLLVLAVLSGVYWLMWRGWKNRVARFEREAAPDVFVPAEDVAGVQAAPGIAGKVTGGEGVVLVTWRLGDRVLDTGFHPRQRSERARLIDEVDALLSERTTA